MQYLWSTLKQSDQKLFYSVGYLSQNTPRWKSIFLHGKRDHRRERVADATPVQRNVMTAWPCLWQHPGTCLWQFILGRACDSVSWDTPHWLMLKLLTLHFEQNTGTWDYCSGYQVLCSTKHNFMSSKKLIIFFLIGVISCYGLLFVPTG